MPDDVTARKVNRLFLVPVSGVNIFFPVADTERHGFLRLRTPRRLAFHRRCTRQSGKRCRKKRGQNSRGNSPAQTASFPYSGPQAVLPYFPFEKRNCFFPAHSFSPFSCPDLFFAPFAWYRFIPITMTITARKITVESAHSAVLIVVCEPFVALTT